MLRKPARHAPGRSAGLGEWARTVRDQGTGRLVTARPRRSPHHTPGTGEARRAPVDGLALDRLHAQGLRNPCNGVRQALCGNRPPGVALLFKTAPHLGYARRLFRNLLSRICVLLLLLSCCRNSQPTPWLKTIPILWQGDAPVERRVLRIARRGNPGTRPRWEIRVNVGWKWTDMPYSCECMNICFSFPQKTTGQHPPGSKRLDRRTLQDRTVVAQRSAQVRRACVDADAPTCGAISHRTRSDRHASSDPRRVVPLPAP